MKSIVLFSFSLGFLTLASIAEEITLTPKDGKAKPVVINTSEKSEVTLGGKTYLVQPKAEPASMVSAKEIRIPRISFQNTPLKEAIEYFRQRYIEIGSTNEELRGLNIVLKNTGDVSIPDLQLRNVTFFDALGMVAELTNNQIEFRESVVVISKKEGQ